MVSWLTEWKWDVWQEVSPNRSDDRADIVAVRDRRVMVVEAKKSLTFDVIYQADRWSAHYRAVVVPYARPSEGRALAGRVCEWLGLGLYEAYIWDHDVKETIPPRLHRQYHASSTRMIEALADFPRSYVAAGSPTGGHWSKYRGTMDRVWAYVKANPGCTVRDVVKDVKHHYASPQSAVSAIPKWLTTIEKDRFRVEVDGRTLRLYVVVGTGPMREKNQVRNDP